ncbi:hypothetical protein H257_12943 [Aphanomyces astaci]|uniref:Uncharacterized protein n=1 Tax=Aphanomyces astaci TaxID=112090 RepID=W4FYN9_APHAT|nr:hypothetical protein H257_12943 [Aphanomyces astaci]ETV71798.1 hypothetical protein H257_12943 [Aphanomyces astaci]|eukprot:XP_009838647.1 hypothetical protein H257_12943 [Aphanomyces astaci]
MPQYRCERFGSHDDTCGNSEPCHVLLTAQLDCCYNHAPPLVVPQTPAHGGEQARAPVAHTQAAIDAYYGAHVGYYGHMSHIPKLLSMPTMVPTVIPQNDARTGTMPEVDVLGMWDGRRAS